MKLPTHENLIFHTNWIAQQDLGDETLEINSHMGLDLTLHQALEVTPLISNNVQTLPTVTVEKPNLLPPTAPVLVF